MPLTPRFTITNQITSDLAAIERARGFLEAATLSETWVRRMSSRALLLEAHHTTHIEGTQLTIDQSARAWAGDAPPESRPDDVRELLNYREAFDLVSDYLASGDPITEGLIREIHRRLVQDVRGGEGQPGSYRVTQNYVANAVTREIVYTPPSPLDVPPLMREIVDWLRDPGDVHPVLVAGIAQFQLVHSHPFVDGNGRTSRLLSTLCLYRAGYDFRRLFTLSEYYDRDRAGFYGALQAVRTGMDLTGWLEYFTRGLASQLLEVRARGETAILADVVAQHRGLNARQADLLAIISTEPGLSINDLHERVAGVDRRTLQRDLHRLLELQLIAHRGGAAGPGRTYHLAPDSVEQM